MQLNNNKARLYINQKLNPASVFKDGDHALLQPAANRSPGRSHTDGHMGTILVSIQD